MQKWYDKHEKRLLFSNILWHLAFIIPIVTAVLLIIMRYRFIGKLWWLTDYVGIASLGVGIGGVGFTLWTFYKTGITKDEVLLVKDEVSQVKNEVLRVRKEHELVVRLPEHKTDFEVTKAAITQVRLSLSNDNESLQDLQIRIKEQVILCKVSGASLIERLTPDIRMYDVIQQLVMNCEDYINRKKYKDMNQFKDAIGKIFDKLNEILDEITQIEKDRNARL